MHCTKIEVKIIDFCKKHLDIIFIICITLIGCMVRYSGRWYLSSDAGKSFVPWFETIKANGGLKGLSEPVGNYGVPFQVIVALLTYLPFKPLYSFKLLFIAFDFILAVVAGLITYECTDKRKVGFILGYTAVLLSPNVIMNSSIWAQCDSMYVTFLMLAFYFLLKEKIIKLFIAFSLAFSLKLQAIFFLPMFIILYFARKKYSLLNLLILPIVLFLTSLPAFLFGRSIFGETVSIYTDQVGMFSKMYLNYPSFWAIFGDGSNGKYMQLFALGITIGILGLGLFFTLRSGKKSFTQKELCLLALWSCWTCVLFLPSMHERYGYIVDILGIVLAIIDIKYIGVAFVHNLIGSMSYVKHLFSYSIIDREVLSIVNLVFWLLLTLDFFYNNIYKAKKDERNF